ncbi:MAG: hypothetical protein ACHP6I_00935 [Rickettsiales bacterium]
MLRLTLIIFAIFFASGFEPAHAYRGGIIVAEPYEENCVTSCNTQVETCMDQCRDDKLDCEAMRSNGYRTGSCSDYSCIKNCEDYPQQYCHTTCGNEIVVPEARIVEPFGYGHRHHGW